LTAHSKLAGFDDVDESSLIVAVIIAGYFSRVQFVVRLSMMTDWSLQRGEGNVARHRILPQPANFTLVSIEARNSFPESS